MDEKQNTVDTLDAPDEALSPTAGSPLSAVRPIARLPALAETVRRQVRASISCRSCANRYLPTIKCCGEPCASRQMRIFLGLLPLPERAS